MKVKHRVLLLSIMVLTAAAAGSAQDFYQVNMKPVRGFLPNMDQLTGPVDSIDPINRKMHLEIPLASLPPNRGGSSFDLKLVYDSHLYDLGPEALPPPYPWDNSDPPTPPAAGYRLGPAWGTRGGWNLNIDNIGLELEERIVPQSGTLYDCGYLPRIYRLRVRLPDGSQHVMHLKGNYPSSGDAFFPMDPAGRLHCPSWTYQGGGYIQVATGWLTYFSNDGSYLKLEIYADGSGDWIYQPWYLYFPDGRKIVSGLLQGTDIYDPNGNRVHIGNFCGDPECNQLLYGVADDAGHNIQISGTEDTTTVTTVGPNGPMTSTLNWQTFQLGLDGRTFAMKSPTDSSPWDMILPLQLVVQGLKYVQLPLAPAVGPGDIPPVWNSYAFGYADDSDDGYGEVDYVRTPTGAVFQYRYSAEGPYTAPSAVIANDNKVRERRVSYQGGTDLVWTYDGGPNAFYAWNDQSGNATVTNPDTAVTTYWFGPTAAYSDTSGISYGYSYGYGNVIYRIDESNGRVTKRVWSINPPFTNGAPQDGTPPVGNQNAFVKRETITVGNSAGAPALTAVTDRTIDKNGNLLQTIEYDWVTYDPSGPEAGGSVRRTTQFTYHASVPDYTSTADDSRAYWNPHFSPLAPTEARRLDAVQRKEVRDGNGTIVAVTEFDYDDAYRSGNVTAEKRWDSVKSGSAPGPGQLSSGNSQMLVRSYGAFGNLEDIYEPEVRTHITYDPTGSFPTRVDYAYQTPEQRSWAYDWNVPAGTINAKTDLDNNITISYGYDNVGRQTVINEANLRKTETLYDDANMKVTVKKDLAAFADGKLQVTSEYDQLGRVALVRTSEPGNTDGIKVKTAYYPTLNRTVVSSPYRTTADATLEWTCTQTDASKRVTAVAVFKGSVEPTDCESTSNRTGITRTAYDSNWTWVSDPASKVRGEGRDGLGQLVQVLEDPSGFYYQAFYTYDGLGNLVQVNQGAQTRTFQYSSLGRLLSASNPESGTISYVYADSGDLLSRTDARGIAATFTYDPMHRIKTKTYSDGTPPVTYTYYLSGAGSPKAGQLQSVSSAVAWIQNNNYDGLGRVTSSSHTIAGDPAIRNFLYSYWLNNSVRTVTNPSGRVIQYDLDDAGRTAKVYAGGTTYADMTVTSTPYTADGKIAQMRLGNNLWETRSYQAPGTPTLFRLGAVQGANDKLELEYNVSATANNGNLESHVIRQPAHTWTQTYGYDGVNRLTAASEAAGWSQTYGYDQYGNRWVATTSGPPDEIHEPRYQTMFNANTNRFTVESGITYDLAGNQTYYAPWTLGYDAENRNTTVASGSTGNGVYAYDGDGRRVKKTWTPSGGSPTTTYYLHNALGQLAAEYSTAPSTAGTSYIHTDMLGSTRMVTDASGATLECYDYLPFGRMLSDGINGRNVGCYPSNPDLQINSKLPQKFTGKERDSETRLDYFGARYLSAAQGRFMSPDPYNLAFELSKAKSEKEKVSLRDSHIGNPSVWNRYAYTLNNPLRFIDPTGECSKPIQDKDETGICIEAFIASKKIDNSRIGLGDDRKHSATDASLTARSSVKVIVAPSGKIELEVESARSSVLLHGLGFQGSTTAEIVQNKLNADGSRTIGLNMAAVNGEYGLPFAPSGAIQGMFNFTITKDGVVSLNEAKSAVTEYPSWGIYSYEAYGAQPRVLKETHETNIEALKKAPVPLTRVK